ncbi:MAG: hypothetical protein M3506_09405 [Chloroflexota bacterium]|nr:hypothetical protein [Chloroflexota bacterium]
MFEVLTSALTVCPVGDQDLPSTYCTVRQRIQQQAEGFANRFDVAVPVTWQSMVAWDAQDGRAHLDWSEWESSSSQGAALSHVRLEWKQGGSDWQAEVKLGMTEGAIVLTAAWSRSAYQHDQYPFKSIPPMLASLADFGVHSLSLDGAFAPHEVTTDTVASFHRDIVANPARRIPIILVSPESGTQRPGVDVDELARKLFGLAHVYWFADDAVGRSYAAISSTPTCRNGAGRLYWPSNDPGTADRFLPMSALKPEAIEALFTDIARKSPRWFETPEALRCIEHAQRQEERRQRQEAIEKLATTESDSSEWQQLAQEQEATITEQGRTIARQQVELETLRRELQTERANNLALSTPFFPQLDPEAVLPPLEAQTVGVYLSPRARISLESARGNQKQQFLQELRKLARPELRRRNSKRIKNDTTDCYIFPQGGTSTRIMYYVGPSQTIQVCELVDHDTYEQLLERRAVFKKEYPVEYSTWYPLPLEPVLPGEPPTTHGAADFVH